MQFQVRLDPCTSQTSRAGSTKYFRVREKRKKESRFSPVLIVLGRLPAVRRVQQLPDTPYSRNLKENNPSTKHVLRQPFLPAKLDACDFLVARLACNTHPDCATERVRGLYACLVARS